MRENRHKKSLKKEVVIGSIESAYLDGDFYSIGMSLSNILGAILSTYGLDMGEKLIEEAMRLAATEHAEDTNIYLSANQLEEIKTKIEDENS